MWPVTLWSALKSRRTSSVCPFSTGNLRRIIERRRSCRAAPRCARRRPAPAGGAARCRRLCRRRAPWRRRWCAARACRLRRARGANSCAHRRRRCTSARASTKPGAVALTLCRAPGRDEGVVRRRRRRERQPVDADVGGGRLGGDGEQRRRRPRAAAPCGRARARPAPARSSSPTTRRSRPCAASA